MINNMEKHTKDLKKIKVERDFFETTLIKTNANQQKFKSEKDSLSVEHNKLQRYYKNMYFFKIVGARGAHRRDQ